MDQVRGLSAASLSDIDLERQVTRAHATRNWIFLHGTGGQYRRHTERMLELEQEYLSRHPQRTWQGTADDERPFTANDRIHQIHEVLQMFESEMGRLLTELTGLAELAVSAPTVAGDVPVAAEDRLLARYAEAPDGRMHKLEAHQAARQLGLHPAQVAILYRQDPPFLEVQGAYRVLTDAGRASVATLTGASTSVD